MKKLRILICLMPLSALATSYTEFYVDPAGNNLNSGSTSNLLADYYASGGFFTNNTSATVCTWVKAGQTWTNVAVGSWASIYPDASTTNVFVGRVTATNATDITVSLTAKAGTVPASDAVGATSIRIGGAWAGPSSNNATAYANGFPLAFAAATLTNASGNVPSVNFRSAAYCITNAITHALAGPIIFAGYTNSPRDGGRATFIGTTNIAAYVMLTISGADCEFRDFIMATNGGSGNANGLLSVSGYSIFKRIIVHDTRNVGIYNTGSAIWYDCEIYNCNTGAYSYGVGLYAGYGTFHRMIARNNTAATTYGIRIHGLASFYNCIIASNSLGGMYMTYCQGPITIENCDFYNNGGSGINMDAASMVYLNIVNCNFFKNGAYGITSTTFGPRAGMIMNCAFGSGTQTNASGNINTTVSSGVQNSIDIQGTITYGANDTPWTDPANGNFTLKSTATTLAAGYAKWTQSTINSPTNTVSYPDIGAAQRASTNTTVVGGSSGGSYIFAQ